MSSIFRKMGERINLFYSVKGLQPDGPFTDLTVVCGGHRFGLHKSIVCPQSPFFDKICSSHSWQEGFTDQIDLGSDVDPTVFAQIVSFLYTGSCEEGAAAPINIPSTSGGGATATTSPSLAHRHHHHQPSTESAATTTSQNSQQLLTDLRVSLAIYFTASNLGIHTLTSPSTARVFAHLAHELFLTTLSSQNSYPSTLTSTSTLSIDSPSAAQQRQQILQGWATLIADIYALATSSSGCATMTEEVRETICRIVAIDYPYDVRLRRCMVRVMREFPDFAVGVLRYVAEIQAKLFREGSWRGRGRGVREHGVVDREMKERWFEEERETFGGGCGSGGGGRQ